MTTKEIEKDLRNVIFNIICYELVDDVREAWDIIDKDVRYIIDHPDEEFVGSVTGKLMS